MIVVRILIACLACVAALSAAGPATRCVPAVRTAASHSLRVTNRVRVRTPCLRRGGQEFGPADRDRPGVARIAPGLVRRRHSDSRSLTGPTSTPSSPMPRDLHARLRLEAWTSSKASPGPRPATGSRRRWACAILDECRADIHVIESGSYRCARLSWTSRRTPSRNETPPGHPGGDRIAFDTIARRQQRRVHDGCRRQATWIGSRPILPAMATPTGRPPETRLPFTSARDGADADLHRWTRTEPPADAAQRPERSGRRDTPHGRRTAPGSSSPVSGGRSRSLALVTITADGASESPSRARAGPSRLRARLAAGQHQPMPRPRRARLPSGSRSCRRYAPCAAPEPHARPAARVRLAATRRRRHRGNVTVGTPDANGAAANSAGFVRFVVWPPLAACPAKPTSRSR